MIPAGSKEAAGAIPIPAGCGSPLELMELCRCGGGIAGKMMGAEGSHAWELSNILLGMGMGNFRISCSHALGTAWRSVGGWGREISEQGIQRGNQRC